MAEIAAQQASLRDWAQWYLDSGYMPIPWVVAPGQDGGKPSKRAVGLSGFHYDEWTAETSRELVARWQPEWQVGIVASASSGLVAVDFDSMDQAAEFASAHTIPDTFVSKTGRDGGGFHLIYRRGAIDPGPQSPWGPGFAKVDVKSKGFIAVAPSMHPSGRRYEGRLPPAADLPQADLLFAARPVSRANGNGSGNGHAGLGDWDDFLDARGGVAGLVALMGSLRNLGLSQEACAETARWVNANSRSPMPVSRLDAEVAGARFAVQAGADPVLAGWAIAVAAEAVATADEKELASQTRAEYVRERARAAARVMIADDEALATEGHARSGTLGEFAAKGDLPYVIDGALAAEACLLGGPDSAGKSLLARDWAVSLVTMQPWRGCSVPEKRRVLWVGSEGLHDLRERWGPWWDQCKDQVDVTDLGVKLSSPKAVARFVARWGDEAPGLVVLDTIYGAGMMQDDNGVKDVVPTIEGMKDIAQAFRCAVLAVGHSGHGDGLRRFRGSSTWRQLTAVEWHLAGGILTCERSKLAKRFDGMLIPCVPDYPWLSYPEQTDALARAAQDTAAAEEHMTRLIGENPGMPWTRLRDLIRMATGMQNGPVGNLRTSLLQRGIIDEQHGPHGARFYSLSSLSDVD